MSILLAKKHLAFASLIAGLSLSLPPAAAHLEAKHRHSQPQRIEVAFVLDTTGSMASLIDGAKKKIWSIANTIVDINPNADVRMALIGYRDFGDKYVTKSFDMTRDIQGLYGKLLKFQAYGGGDMPEAVNEALNASVKDLHWSKQENTRRIIFLVGDAPPHMDYNGPKYAEIVSEARQAGIVVNAVQAGRIPSTRAVWKKIAYAGGGDYIPIPQDGGHVVTIETPFDSEIIILQKQIDSTIIPYGTRRQRTMLQEKLRTKSSAPTIVQLENSTFYAKRKFSRDVVTGRGDLIADIRNGRAKLGSFSDKELPTVLKNKTSSERKSWVQNKLETRKKLEIKMQALVTRRDSFIAAKSSKIAGAEKKDAFYKAVNRVLKRQLK
jgi:Mg-chelatase subunit ChlD